MTASTEPPAPRNGAIKNPSQSERLLGVSDEKPQPAERPARKRTRAKPKPAPSVGAELVFPEPVTYLVEGEWDPQVNPDGYFVATELAGGESK